MLNNDFIFHFLQFNMRILLFALISPERSSWAPSHISSALQISGTQSRSTSSDSFTHGRSWLSRWPAANGKSDTRWRTRWASFLGVVPGVSARSLFFYLIRFFLTAPPPSRLTGRFTHSDNNSASLIFTVCGRINSPRVCTHSVVWRMINISIVNLLHWEKLTDNYHCGWHLFSVNFSQFAWWSALTLKLF